MWSIQQCPGQPSCGRLLRGPNARHPHPSHHPCPHRSSYRSVHPTSRHARENGPAAAAAAAAARGAPCAQPAHDAPGSVTGSGSATQSTPLTPHPNTQPPIQALPLQHVNPAPEDLHSRRAISMGSGMQLSAFTHHMAPPHQPRAEPALDLHSRRDLLLSLPCLPLAVSSLLALDATGLVSMADAAGMEAGALALSTSAPVLSGPLAAAFTRSVYDALRQLQVMDEVEFQKENYLLREREFRYYKEANKDRLQAIPDLSDQSGGLSQPAYFNFVSYISWKVIARHVKGAEARTRFCQVAGAALLQQVWPQGLEAAQAAAAKSGGRAREADVVSLLQTLLGMLQEGGYCNRYQLVWGEQPGGWPQDWMVAQPQLAGMEPLADAAASPGFGFQVKVHRPADIEGSVALRSEEDGFWSRAVSSMVTLLLGGAGYQASADEFFFQDQWEGPRTLGGKLLLGLGDPFEQVGIDFNPTTLVQDWDLK